MNAAILLLLLVAAPVVPGKGGRFAPGRLEIDRGQKVKGAELRDVETCGACHPDAVAQWRTSAHAFASFNNPIYRVSIDRLRAQVGKTPSRMCASCHDVALLTEGAMESEIAPEDPRAHAAITCQTCHTAVRSAPDGNGSIVLAGGEVPLPKEGDAASLARHRAAVGPAPLRTSALCGACHRSFLNAETGNASAFFGMDDLTPWSRSAWAHSEAERVDAPLPLRTCQGCHMAREPATFGDVSAKDGTIASHRFLGGHSWLAASLGDQSLVQRYADHLRGVVTVDIAAARLADGTRVLPADHAPLRTGETIDFDVVLFNASVGHRFPAGVLDAQDTRLEVTLTDASGALLAQSRAHALRSEVLDAQGEPQRLRQTHAFVTSVWNNTIGPRDARATRLRFAVPPGLALPVTLRAQLVHRSRNGALAHAACAESQTALGQRFSASSLRLNGVAMNPCAEQPVTVIAEHQLTLGATPGAGAQAPSWLRLYQHGLALLHGLQEELSDARPSLLLAAELLEAAHGSALDKARVQAALAQVAARQGLLDEALARLAAAQALVPGHPALDRIRGDAFAAVWRWPEAAKAYRQCTERAPGDVVAWELAAVALASGGEAAPALEAAARGLALQPRSPELLRVQALALRDLHAPVDRAKVAFEAWASWKAPDEAPAVKGRCSAKVEGCATERNPVPVRWLEPVLVEASR